MITSSIRAQTRNVLFPCCRLYFPNGIATPRTLLPACSRVGLSRMQPLHGRIGQRHISSIDSSGERSSEQAQQPDVLLGVSPGSQPQVRTTHPDATSTLFVGKLSPWATVADIEELFQGYGDMQVRMQTTSSGQNRGYAHIQFTSKHYASQAMRQHERSPFQFADRNLKLDYAVDTRLVPKSRESARSRTLYVGNLPYSADPDDLRALLAEFGEIEDVRIDYDWKGLSRGFAHVNFASSEDGQRVLDRQWEEPFQLQQRRLFISLARAPKAQPSQAKVNHEEKSFHRSFPPSETIWVGGLPSTVTKKDLRDMFERFGEIKAIRISYRKDNRSRYFAHIDFGSKDVTQAIIDEHKRTPLTLNNGRQIIVDFAPPAIIEDTSPYYTLYMAAFRGDEARLREYFGLHSPFIRRIAFLPQNKSLAESQPRPVFIEFDTVERATAAMNAMNGAPTPEGGAFELRYARRPKMPSRLATEHEEKPTDFGISDQESVPKHYGPKAEMPSGYGADW
ncbi:hypothetical protein AcV7_010080 [Taiwanofungus camphoratus]|nr:hypothetical protein AcV7_010080 [Antrodia cinnamomea]KAI0945981.1 hypothetical protein AcV7_010080 [Antrodia cinnamomea]